MPKIKPYRATSLSGAQARVRSLENQVERLTELVDRLWAERNQLAKLAAEGAAFYNPLEVMAAKKVRDMVLREHFSMNADGSPLHAAKVGA